jgi:hypothetical protein
MTTNCALELVYDFAVFNLECSWGAGGGGLLTT